MDNKDVIGLFDKNIPYELRLRDAIMNDLIVPFHYYGIRDKLADYGIKDNNKIATEIAKAENIDFITAEIEKHRPQGKLKAIAFCTSIAHAELMAEQFEDAGYPAIALTGANGLGERIKAFNDLQDDDNPIEIICAVDILNEGVDIPQVNMVLFLRPTESTTIFLQQLGRGLRKALGKQYVTVLDFIGNNYDRSVQIALALGSLANSTGIDKPFIRDMLRTNYKALNIPGVIIDIDELAKEDVLKYLDNCNINRIEYLKNDYENFKKHLQKETYPLHIDYLNNDVAPNLLRLMKASIAGTKNKSYYTFLKKIGEKTLPIFSAEQVKLIDNISELLPLVRVDEYLIFNQLVNEAAIKLNDLIGFNNIVSIATLNHALAHLIKLDILDENYKLKVNKTESFVNFINDILSYGLKRYEIEFGDFNTEFKLYGNYYSEQIQTVKLQSFNAYMRGTEFDTKNKTTYCYVTLHKDVSRAERLKYKDKFLNSSIFQWESVKNTTLKTGDGPKLEATKIVHLFIRKVKVEDNVVLPYTYFGTGHFKNPRVSETKEFDKELNSFISYPTLIYDIELDYSVPEEYWFDFDIEGETND